MPYCNIRQIWEASYKKFCSSRFPQSDIQRKASRAILNCKTGSLGINMNICPDCGHIETHNNSCRDRNCPNCQAVNKEIWVDQRRSEVIDTSYFHVVFTLPHELNPLIYCNQKLLYGLFHKCCGRTLLALPQMLRTNTPGVVRKPQISWRDTRYYSDPPYLESRNELPCPYALHHFGRRSYI